MTAEQIRTTVELFSGKDFMKRKRNGKLIRKREFMEARHLWFFLCVNHGKKEIYFDDDIKYKPYSLTELGELVDQSHCTVINSCNKAKNLIDTDPEIKKLYLDCIREIEYRTDEIELSGMNTIERTEWLKDREIQALIKEHKLELKRTRNALNDKFVQELLTLPYVYRDDFIKTRFRPYMQMVEAKRKRIININDIEVVC